MSDVTILKVLLHAGKAEQITAILVKSVIVELKNIPNTLELVGTVKTIQTVSVKSQVTGQIVKVNFQEGQTVKVGDLLFEAASNFTGFNFMYYTGNFPVFGIAIIKNPTGKK